MQCHGTKIELDENKRPTPETWPNNGMGNIYPDGATGSCTACHSRHKFSIAEARNPNACASCHLGPDHPNIEIFNKLQARPCIQYRGPHLQDGYGAGRLGAR